MVSSIKLQVARAQLGTALYLFIKDRDPWSVHALASGGAEIMEGIAGTEGIEMLSTDILLQAPGVDLRKIRALRNQYWNGIKHFYKLDGKTARDDEALLGDFTDSANDTPLFLGWLDYMNVMKRLPVEVQVFQVWWYCTNEERMNPASDPAIWRSVFPKIAGQPRAEQKRRLRRAIEKYKKDFEVGRHPATERAPLISHVDY